MKQNVEQCLNTFFELSKRYGGDERYALLGGTISCKINGEMYLKILDTEVATANQKLLMQENVDELLEMLEKEYAYNDSKYEQFFVEGMIESLSANQLQERSSAECLLHVLFPQTYVLQLHPAIISALTCGKNGEESCAKLFGNEALWVSLDNPGYSLARTCRKALNESLEIHEKKPNFLLIRKHGMIIAADSADELNQLADDIFARIGKEIKAEPEFAPISAPKIAVEIAPALRSLYQLHEGDACVVFHNSNTVKHYISDVRLVRQLTYSYTREQIFYCGNTVLVLNERADIADAFSDFVTSNGFAPKITIVENVGVFVLGVSKKEADFSLAVFLDTLRTVLYAEVFGGAAPLIKELAITIVNAKTESDCPDKPLYVNDKHPIKGKVCIVTGGAQGFGAGIAESITSRGGYVVVADMNKVGAEALAEKICQKFGDGIAIGVEVNVTNEDSVRQMVESAVLHYGGLDVMISCAGILIAGSLENMSADAFSKVTAVNYNGYFLCAKHAIKPMKIQRRFNTDYMADIIEINSKSGLEGSKANFAYAGSKFGGIGLTQSFALELAPFGIKVNAICPGNLLDGPLWSDPERGLFRQYLDTGKVPGAKTIEDVRRFYEAKVPLGRGCSIEDVAKAVFYIVDQKYETGQAVPVTGGQVMLN